MMSLRERRSIIIPELETEKEVRIPMEPCSGGGGAVF